MSRAAQLLLVEGLVSEAQLGKAAELQKALGGTLGLNLVRMGAIAEDDLRRVMCTALGLEAVEAAVLAAVPDQVAAILPATAAVDNRVVPVALNGDWLVLAMADPSDDGAIAELSRRTGLRLLPKVARESQVTAALERLYGTASPAELPRGKSTRWAEPIKVEPIELRPSRRSQIPDKRRGPTAAGGYREPVVLEGRYERITSEDLPDDASAGYIPLTKVKQHGAGQRASVIEVRSVQVGPEPSASAPMDEEQLARAPTLAAEDDSASTWAAPAPPTQAHGGAPSEPAAPPLPEPQVAPAAADVERAREHTVPISRGPFAETDSWDPPSGAEDTEEARGADADAVTDADSWDPPPPRGLEAPEAPSQRGFSDAVRELETVGDRDSAIALALEVLLLGCKRAAFFTVKRGVVEGFGAAGAGITRGQVRGVWIPLASPCTLRDVCEYRRPRVGPVGDSRADAIFVSALGGRRGDSIFVPVIAGDRVVAVLYGDDLRGAAPSTRQLERLGDSMGAALERLLKVKRRDVP